MEWDGKGRQCPSSMYQDLYSSAFACRCNVEADAWCIYISTCHCRNEGYRPQKVDRFSAVYLHQARAQVLCKVQVWLVR